MVIRNISGYRKPVVHWRHGGKWKQLLGEVKIPDLRKAILDVVCRWCVKNKFAIMKKGVRIVNLARGGLFVNADLLDAIEKGIVSCYVTDFPEDDLLGNDKVITIPHLGASTPESEDNCAMMSVNQLRDFLERGNIKNSVNFPECILEGSGNTRLTIININVPNMVGQFTTILAANEINIADMVTHHKDNIGYNIIDVEGDVTEEVVQKIKDIEGVKAVRVIR